ncbi:MAG: hypothetical protein ABW133_21565, partial [Polyangiaceae bacterium]
MNRRNLGRTSAASTRVLAWMLGAAAMGCGSAPESADRDESRTTRAARPLIDRSFDEDARAVAATFPAAWDLVQRFLGEEKGLEGRSIAAVTTIHRPDVDGVAYLELALHREGGDAGYVIVSTAAHDVPIVAWSDRGPAFAARLRLENRENGARIFMTGPGAFVVERADGSPASLDAPMTRGGWTMAKEQFVRARAANKIESANRAVQAWQRLAERNALAAADFVEELARGADLLWPPNYAQFSGTFDNGSCKVGCVPNAFTQIAAWASHQAGDHRDASVWAHPRMAYAFDGAEDLWAPPSYDSNLAAVTTQFRRQLGTTCS